MSETLTQHVVLSDVEYDHLVSRLSLAQAVVVAAHAYVKCNLSHGTEVYCDPEFDALFVALSAAQEREGERG